MDMKQKCRGGCGIEKSIDQYSLKPDGSHYKHCDDCRKNRGSSRKESVTENTLCEINNEKEKEKQKEINNEKQKEINNEKQKEKRRENRPIISDEKKQIILKEQNNNCRGPGKNECDFYECDMKLNHKKFNDKKAVLPQYDHIVRWKGGGNGIGNIQALCPNCHWMKTRMESLLLDDENAGESIMVTCIYESLSKKKYENNITNYDSSDSDDSLF